ncbi:Nse4 C-terminal-domain-containing protein [Lineolata rhizophorae]|uniref:Non-structural maintenance of chromosomes element 4 n=1 Tax=Lineolata rhizophorae TaxID=578093 RepID=A0A6A6NX58_9PEZI|nr:Nse4 C-terminal-domain-containing protein [Lineolata rhizophorae]
MAPPARPSGGSSNTSGDKRRRLGERGIPTATRTASIGPDPNAIVDQQFYDPDQDPEERRRIIQHMRGLRNEIRDRRDELVASPGNHDLLRQMLERSDRDMNQVKQTSDATMESANFLSLVDISVRKANAEVDGNLGVDLDEFIGKCIGFMRRGGPPPADTSPAHGEEGDEAATQARRHGSSRRSVATEGDELDDDDGDALNWGAFGSRACFPGNLRPPVPAFLLGPLSVQKRARQATQRRARLGRPEGPTSRPEDLKASDIERNENANITAFCVKVRQRLKSHIEDAMEAVEDNLEDDMTEEQEKELLRRYRVQSTDGESGLVGFFDFVINPKSFGQTIENMFAVSFLIRDGNVAIEEDENGLPLLRPENPRTIEEQRREEVSKHQAIFSLDWETWQNLVQAFDIREPIIPHRNEEEGRNVTGRGWYG